MLTEFERMLILLNGGGVPVFTGEQVVSPGQTIKIQHNADVSRVMYLFSDNEELEVSLDSIEFFKLKHLISTDYKFTICGRKTVYIKNPTTLSSLVIWSIWDYCEELKSFTYPCQVCGKIQCEHRG